MDAVFLFCVGFFGQLIVPAAAFSSFDFKVNVARGRPAYAKAKQSGPELAVDGKITSATAGCFQTHVGDTNPYLLVDLGKNFTITDILLTARDDCCYDKLKDFTIRLFDIDPRKPEVLHSAHCANETGPFTSGETRTYPCPQGSSGRWVKIEKSSAELSFCELGVRNYISNTESVNNLTCTFEEGEDLMQDCGLFPATASVRAVWTRGRHQDPSLKPQVDHTTENGAKNGSFLYVDATSYMAGDVAEMLALSINTAGVPALCLTFWYYRTGVGQKDSSLRVLQYEVTFTNGSSTKWKSDSRNIAAWRRAQVQLAPGFGNSTRLVFQATIDVSKDKTFSYAIDDLTVTREKCPPFREPVDSISCDFEDPSGNICDFGQEVISDSTDWLWRTADKPSDPPGPSVSSGYYMSLEAKPTASPPVLSALFTPVFRAPFPRSCVRFQYFVTAPPLGLPEMSVKVASSPGAMNFRTSDTQVLWSRTLTPQTNWTDTALTLSLPPLAKIVFEASHEKSSVYLDNIRVDSLECSPVEEFSCNFETVLCDFLVQSTSDDQDWATRKESHVSLTGADKDHTRGDGTGYYAYANFTTGGQRVDLMSPRIESSASQSCLVFWYVAASTEEMDTLAINTSTPNLTDSQPVWILRKGLTGIYSGHWARAAVTLDTSKPSRLTFSATNAPHAFTTFCIDDLELKKGPCSSEKERIGGFSCTFEQEDLCGVGQPTLTDDFDWTWFTGATRSGGTGPEKDHTSGTGYYLYTEASLHRAPGEKAILYTPTIVPTFPKTCLTFFYNMRGSHMGSLSVYLALSSSPIPFSRDSAERVWTRNGYQSRKWFKASIELNIATRYKIYIEGVLGTGHMSDMAIDDLQIQSLDCASERPVSNLTCSFDAGKEDCGLMYWPFGPRLWATSEPTDSGITPSPLSGGNFTSVTLDGSIPGATGMLVSRVIRTLSTSQSCLEFWYYVRGNTGKLTLVTTDAKMVRKDPVWAVTRDSGGRWNKAAFTLQTSARMRFILEVLEGRGTGVIAVDDLKLRKGPCPFDRAAVNSFKCDFEHPDQCWFQQGKDGTDDQFDWTWQNGTTPDSAVTGPNGDHTTGNGYYMYIEASPPRTENDTARLVSPKVSANAAGSCLSYWYSMSGSEVGRLKTAVVAGDGQPSPLGELVGNQGPGWKKEAVALPRVSSAEYRFYLEAVVGPGKAGDIAIDDIELSDNPCPPAPSVNCSFSDVHLCGFTQSTIDDRDWTLSQGDGNLTSDQPAADHTTGNGTFMHGQEYLPRAALVSPALSWDVLDNCLTFDCSVKGGTPGSLSVYLAPAGRPHHRSLLWNRTHTDPSRNLSARIDFQLHYPVQIIFEAVGGPGSSGDIALDSIKVLPRTCQDDVLTCDFTEGSCQYNHQTTSVAPWVRLRGETPTDNTGPAEDHTDGSGYYVYSDLGQLLNTIQGNAILASSELSADTGVGCLSFWFMMYGTSIRSLSVFTASPTDRRVNRQALWTRTMRTDQNWRYAEVSLNITEAVKVYFEAMRNGIGDPAKYADVALDDILFRKQPCGLGPVSSSPIDCDFSSTDDPLCGYTQLNTDPELAGWKNVSQSTTDSPVNFTESFVYLERAQTPTDVRRTSVLVSPDLSLTPTKACLSFWIHGTNTSSLSVMSVETASGANASISWNATTTVEFGWTKAVADITLTSTPVKFHFIATYKPDHQGRLMANIGLDDVQITMDTCFPVAMQENWRFTCGRPTTPCVQNQGACDSATGQCQCQQGFYGQQCQYAAAQDRPCTVNLCQRGTCRNDRCICPDTYYGDKCEHSMVQSECTLAKMVVNILPYGFVDVGSWKIRYPETADTSCKLQSVADLPAYRAKGWQGFAREFLHNNDPCGGNVFVQSETVAEITYSRQLLVYYDPLGRDVTDTRINVTCTAVKLPPPRVIATVKDLGLRQLQPAGRRHRVRTDVEIFFSLNSPNREYMTEIKVMQCIASNGVSSISVVNQGCARYPVGSLLYDGKSMGTEYLTMRVYKLPLAPLTLRFTCLVRLCDARFDFSCYQRPLCFGRQKRSVPQEAADTREGNLVTVECSHTLSP